MENVYLVDNYWRVVSSNPYQAQRLLGAYMDLPAEWYGKLTVEFLGRMDRVRLNGTEIRQENLRAA